MGDKAQKGVAADLSIQVLTEPDSLCPSIVSRQAKKQLLAIALLWGLARASGRQLPVAIYTPLGRLDSSHRNNLVEKYFPQARHQVLVLSTDTEIREAEVEQLRNSNAISCEYLLQYDPQQHQTQVKPGYFW